MDTLRQIQKLFSFGERYTAKPEAFTVGIDYGQQERTVIALLDADKNLLEIAGLTDQVFRLKQILRNQGMSDKEIELAMFEVDPDMDMGDYEDLKRSLDLEQE